MNGNQLAEGLIMKTRDGGLPGLQMKTEGKRWTAKAEQRLERTLRKLIFVDNYQGIKSADVYINKSYSIMCEILSSVSAKPFVFTKELSHIISAKDRTHLNS